LDPPDGNHVSSLREHRPLFNSPIFHEEIIT